METTHYPAILMRVITAAAEQQPDNLDSETCIVCDPINQHYQIVYLGWNHDRRIYTVHIHLRLVNDKIYIERDGTPDGIAYTLIDAGIPKDAIVLAFYPPYKRLLTEYAAV